MPQKVLNPLRTKAFGLQKTCNGVSKEMGVQMAEARIGVRYSGLRTESRHDVVDRPWSHHAVAIAEKDRPGFPTADEDKQITEVFVVDDGNDTSFATFAFMDRHPFAFNIDVPHVEIDEFTATNAEPPERFDQAPIPEIASGQ